MPFRRFTLVFFLSALFASQPACLTVGRQVIATPNIGLALEPGMEVKTVKKTSCAHVALPIIFGLLAFLDGGVWYYAAGDASVSEPLRKLIKEWREGAISHADRRGWKLTHITVDRKSKNYIVWGFICTVVEGTFARPSQPKAAAPAPPRARADATSLQCPKGTTAARVGRQHWCEKRLPSGQTVRHGPSMSYHANGKRFAVFHYVNGAKHGPFTYWNSAGHKYREGTYRNGKKHGRWIWWHANGRKLRECEYQDDRTLRCKSE